MKMNGSMGSPSPEMLEHLMRGPRRKHDGPRDNEFWDRLFSLFSSEVVSAARFITLPNLKETLMRGDHRETIPCDIKAKLPRGLFILGCQLSSPDEHQLRQLGGVTDEGRWIFGTVKASGIKRSPRILSVDYVEVQPITVAYKLVCGSHPHGTPWGLWGAIGGELSRIVCAKRAALDVAEEMHIRHHMVSEALSVLKA